jgi:hypothetical protein
MQPRGRTPFPPGNPRMMPPRMPRGGGYPPMNRMGSGMRPPRQQGGGGGLLSKLLGKGGEQRGGNNPFSVPTRSATSTAGRAAGNGGLLKTLTDPNALNGFLTNTQKVLNSAQQITPMVQQYGPLVKNIPSLWKLYRGFKDLPDADDDAVGSEEIVQNVDHTSDNIPKQKVKSKKVISSEDSPTIERRKKNVGQSTPKLYI